MKSISLFPHGKTLMSKGGGGGGGGRGLLGTVELEPPLTIPLNKDRYRFECTLKDSLTAKNNDVSS